MTVYRQESSQLQQHTSSVLGPGYLNFPPLSQVHYEAASIRTLKLLLLSSNVPNDDLIERLDTLLFSVRPTEIKCSSRLLSECCSTQLGRIITVDRKPSSSRNPIAGRIDIALVIGKEGVRYKWGLKMKATITTRKKCGFAGVIKVRMSQLPMCRRKVTTDTTTAKFI